MDILSLFRLNGKKAIVTGSASGLGYAMALGLAEAGVDIVIADVNFKGAEKASKEIRDSGRKSIAVQVDISNPDEVKRMTEQVLKEFGRIDILVNNAGIPPQERVPSHEMKQERWDKVINVDLRGLFLCARFVGTEMIRQKSGKIINIASISGMIVNKGQTGMSGFCAAKAGVIHLTKVLAVEWAKYNINVNCISPGYMRTPALDGIGDEMRKKLTDLVPMGRIGEPKELQGAVLFLASDASSYVTGHNLIVDGGHTAW